MPDPIVDGEFSGGFTDTPDTTPIEATARGGGGGSGSGTTTTTTSLTGSSTGTSDGTSGPTLELTAQAIQGGATVTATSGSTTTTSSPCGCCSNCPTGFVPHLFSTGGLCAGAIDNSVPFYLASEITFTPIAPNTLAGMCLPSGATELGDLLSFDNIYQCNGMKYLTTLSSCNWFSPTPTFEPMENAGSAAHVSFVPDPASIDPIKVYLSAGFRVCSCSYSIAHQFFPWLQGTLALSANTTYVSHSCSPFELVVSGTVIKQIDNYTTTNVATYVLKFTEAVAPFLGTMPKVNRLELPCVHLSPIPIDRANCNCPEKFIYKCDLHGQCRPNSNQGDGIRCCQDCPDYEET